MHDTVTAHYKRIGENLCSWYCSKYWIFSYWKLQTLHLWFI